MFMNTFISRRLKKKQTVLLTHGDSIDKVCDGFRVVGRSTSSGLVSAIADEKAKIYGVQFHPEVDLTSEGRAMIRAFLLDVCGLSGSFTMEDRQKKCLDYIREKVGDKKVLMLLSGGVDSTVCAALLRKALRPDQVRQLSFNFFSCLPNSKSRIIFGPTVDFANIFKS